MATGATLEEAAARHRVSERTLLRARRDGKRPPPAKRTVDTERQREQAREAWRLAEAGCLDFEIAARMKLTRAQAREAVAHGQALVREASARLDEAARDGLIMRARRLIARMEDIADEAQQSGDLRVAQGAIRDATTALMKLMETLGLDAPKPDATSAERDAALLAVLRECARDA
jgi:hypothetical protein